MKEGWHILTVRAFVPIQTASTAPSLQIRVSDTTTQLSDHSRDSLDECDDLSYQNEFENCYDLSCQNDFEKNNDSAGKSN